MALDAIPEKYANRLRKTSMACTLGCANRTKTSEIQHMERIMTLRIARKSDEKRVERSDEEVLSFDKILVRELTPEEMILISGGSRAGGGGGGVTA
ncbi:hypothetical protein [Agrobacterium tumefaciens]|jgi:hypothetical protein|uniref:hypothetical protein n=1 Tax=Agrobacterium tumefaciens TaxID=358 RepID=UPI001387007B|nr:hypothetical protein [Agrobacterium tumefaciens]